MSNAAIPLEGRIHDGKQARVPVAASTTIYKGTLVSIDADGYLTDAVDTSAFFFVGVAAETVDNSAGSDGTKDCTVWLEGAFIFTCTNDAVTDRFKHVYATDNQTVSTTATTNVGAVGRIIGINPGGVDNKVIVKLGAAHENADD
jgi:hypothetical protein